MSGRVFVLSHPWMEGHLKIIAIGGFQSPTDAALDDAVDPDCQVLFHIIAGRPSEVSRRTWYDLRYCQGTAGWLRCPAELAISTVQRIAAQSLEEEKRAAWVRSRRIAKHVGSGPHTHSNSACGPDGLEVSAKRLSDSHANGAGQALAIRGPNEKETCSACRGEMPLGLARCSECDALLVRF
jgi:hypothetical protein